MSRQTHSCASQACNHSFGARRTILIRLLLEIAIVVFALFLAEVRGQTVQALITAIRPGLCRDIQRAQQEMTIHFHPLINEQTNFEPA